MKTLVVPCVWSDEPPVPSWRGDVPGLCADTRTWYLGNSYGQLDLPMTVSNVCRMPNSSTEASGSTLGNGSLRAQLSSAGFNVADFDRIVYLTTRNQGYGFKGLNGGKESWVNCCGSNYALWSMVHELGHSLNLAHPFSLGIGTLTDRMLTLPPLTVLTGGQLNDGMHDKSTSMGYDPTMATFSAPEQEIAGWITPTLFTGGDQTFVLTALEAPGSRDNRAVKIPMASWNPASKRVYWLEYRTGTMDANGVQLRVCSTPTGAGKYDFGAYAPAHINSAFQAGDSITDGTLRIDVLATDGTTATVRLRATQQSAILPTLSLIVDPNTLPLGGGTSQLSWMAINADYVTVDNDQGAQNPNPQTRAPTGSWNAFLARSVTWRVIAYSAYGQIEKTATVLVDTAQPTTPPQPQPPIPPVTNPTGSTQMQIDDAKTATAAVATLLSQLVAGQVSAAQLADIQAAYQLEGQKIAAIVPDTGGGQASADGTLVPPAALLRDASGNTWSLSTDSGNGGFNVLKNGNWFAGGRAVLISWKTGQVKVKNSVGDWYLVTGSGYQATSAP